MTTKHTPSNIFEASNDQLIAEIGALREVKADLLAALEGVLLDLNCEIDYERRLIIQSVIDKAKGQS